MLHATTTLSGLTAASACTDVICYLGLGHVFPANMTGNTVLLGIGLATGDLGAAARSTITLGAFLLGAPAAGAAVPDRPRRRAVVACLTFEIAAMTAFYAGWLSASDRAPMGAGPLRTGRHDQRLLGDMSLAATSLP